MTYCSEIAIGEGLSISDFIVTDITDLWAMPIENETHI